MWLQLARMRFIELYVESRLHSLFLITGKMVRFSFFFVFIVALLTKTEQLVGFSLFQVLVFYMTFNFIDIISQFFFRGVYTIGNLINRGQLDLFLTQPVNVLLRIFSDFIDILDLTTLIPVTIVLGLVITRIETPITLVNFSIYILLLLNAFLLAAAIHTIILAFSVIAQEIYSQIWVYRDLMGMARFPTDIYSQVIQFALTFILPVTVMVTFPTKALIGILSPVWIIGSFLITLIFLSLSIWFWHLALKKYSSISI